MNIPNEYKITTLKHQKTYLVNGELKTWTGDTAEVYSTISSTEEYKPTLLGTVPNLGEEEALEADARLKSILVKYHIPYNGVMLVKNNITETARIALDNLILNGD